MKLRQLEEPQFTLTVKELVVMGSFTVMIGGMPAARVNDMTAHASCVAPIPGPVGKIMPPGCPTVMIGG